MIISRAVDDCSVQVVMLQVSSLTCARVTVVCSF